MTGITGIIYVPLHEEMAQVTKCFPMESDLTDDLGYLSYTTTCGDLQILVVSKNTMGTSTAHSVARQLIDRFRPTFFVCLGIGGSLTDDLDLGDVCFGQEIIDINENQKIEKGRTTYNPKAYNSANEVSSRLSLLSVHPQLSNFYSDWRLSAADNATSELKESAGQFELSPKILSDRPIMCGPVVADKNYKETIRQINRKIACVETETSGVYQALSPGEAVEVIAIRGISDLADDRKGATEASSKGAFRRIAAYNAASFLAENIKHNSFFRKSITASTELTQDAAPAVDPVQALLATLSAEIEEALKETSPEYKAVSRGYALPVPRVQETLSQDADQERIEPLDLLQKSTKILLEVPGSYPDKGLPWLYARSLLGKTLDNRILVPIVLNGDEIKPPKNSIQKLLLDRAPELVNHPVLRPIAIVRSFPFSSSSRSTFALDELSRDDNLTAIVISYGQQAALSNPTQFASLERYSLCDVSFRSIVHFLSANFQLLVHEAEVIAHRLSETFRSYNIAVHPSYFAGIPKEMLSRLSDANNRAEFIDLAVQGYLTFMGAGDTPDVSLKQRTRRLFLRELAFRLTVEQKSMSLPDLLEYVKNYSDQYDFGLKPIDFVHSFFDNGILHEEDGQVYFSITFIQEYLLAERLVADPNSARRYFDPSFGDVDLPTFELYAEIGLSHDILLDVRKRLETAIEQFPDSVGKTEYTEYLSGRGGGAYKSSGHMLTSSIIKPRLFSNLKKNQKYQEALQRAAGDLNGNASSTESKQAILDNTNVAKRGVRSTISAEDMERATIRGEIFRDWSMALIMLGAAAEELDASVKRSIASNVVKLGAMIVDSWLGEINRFDFEAIKREVLENVARESPDSDASAREHFSEILVDVLEMSYFSSPFGTVMNTIIESARNPVLFESLKHVPPGDSAQELLLAVWRLELNDNSGLGVFRNAMRSLPKDSFLRMMLATFLVYRAYWYRSTEAGRRIFATASEEVLKPLGIAMPVDDRDGGDV